MGKHININKYGRNSSYRRIRHTTMANLKHITFITFAFLLSACLSEAKRTKTKKLTGLLKKLSVKERRAKQFGLTKKPTAVVPTGCELIACDWVECPDGAEHIYRPEDCCPSCPVTEPEDDYTTPSYESNENYGTSAPSDYETYDYTTDYQDYDYTTPSYENYGTGATSDYESYDYTSAPKEYYGTGATSDYESYDYTSAPEEHYGTGATSDYETYDYTTAPTEYYETGATSDYETYDYTTAPEE